MNTDTMTVYELLMMANDRLHLEASRVTKDNPSSLDVQEAEHLAEMSKLFCKIVNACSKRIDTLAAVKGVRTSKPEPEFTPAPPKRPARPEPKWQDFAISAAAQRYIRDNQLTHTEFYELVAPIPSGTLSNRLALKYPWRKQELAMLIDSGVLPKDVLEGR